MLSLLLVFQVLFRFLKPTSSSHHHCNLYPKGVSLTLSGLVVVKIVLQVVVSQNLWPTLCTMTRFFLWDKPQCEESCSPIQSVWYTIRPAQLPKSTKCFVDQDSYWFLAVTQQWPSHTSSTWPCQAPMPASNQAIKTTLSFVPNDHQVLHVENVHSTSSSHSQWWRANGMYLDKQVCDTVAMFEQYACLWLTS